MQRSKWDLYSITSASGALSLIFIQPRGINSVTPGDCRSAK
jgi:hypothetical protein